MEGTIPPTAITNSVAPTSFNLSVNSSITAITVPSLILLHFQQGKTLPAFLGLARHGLLHMEVQLCSLMMRSQSTQSSESPNLCHVSSEVSRPIVFVFV